MTALNRDPPTATRLLCGVPSTRWPCNQRVRGPHCAYLLSAHNRPSSCSRPCAPRIPGRCECHIRLQADESRKNGATNGTSPALLSPRCARPLAELFGALIREDNACTVVRFRGQRSICRGKYPLPSPLLTSVGIFPIQRIGSTNETARGILLVLVVVFSELRRDGKSLRFLACILVSMPVWMVFDPLLSRIAVPLLRARSR